MKIFTLILITLFLMMANTTLKRTYAVVDTTPPQLEISTPSKQIWNSTVILFGTAIDESGVQKVTINGAEASGKFTSINFLWIKRVDLKVGVNVFIIKAYDNSPNHNLVEKPYSIWYDPATYLGPTIRLISVEKLPSNNATVRFIVDPNGISTRVDFNYAINGTGYSPFNSGYECNWIVTGTREIIMSYTFTRQGQQKPGTIVEYVVRAENSNGFAYSRLQNVTMIDPVDLPPKPDTTPPYSAVLDAGGQINMPYVWIHGKSWDESNVSKVTLNGYVVEGIKSGNWFLWKHRVELKEGINYINVTSYDNSPKINAISVVSNIIYQKSGYTGPTIKLIPFENLPIDNAIMRLQFNPNNNDVTSIYMDAYYSSVSSGRQILGSNYSGNENQTLTYVFPKKNLEVGDTIHMIYKIISKDKWSFAEANFTVTPPNYGSTKIDSVYPKNSDAGVPITPEISMMFSKHLNIFTITPDKIKVNGLNVPGDVTYSISTHTIIFKPTDRLEYAKDYTISVSKDIEDYAGNKLSEDYKWSFRTVELIIDKAFCQPSICDVGSVVTIKIHAQWSNSTPIAGADLSIDGEAYKTNATGWITFTDTSIVAAMKTWPVTSFNYNGFNKFKQLVDTPSCLWDRVKIVKGGVTNPTTTTGNTESVWFNAAYDYSDVAFIGGMGQIFVNDIPMIWSTKDNAWEYSTRLDAAGKLTFTVSGVEDKMNKLTKFVDLTGPQSITWEKPFIETPVIIASTAAVLAITAAGTIFFMRRVKTHSLN